MCVDTNNYSHSPLVFGFHRGKKCVGVVSVSGGLAVELCFGLVVGAILRQVGKLRLILMGLVLFR